MYVYDCLVAYSSKENPLTLSEIKDYLESTFDLQLEDRAVRKELEELENMHGPYEIVISKSKENYKVNVYHIKNRSFELHELRYLMDAVSSARFISPNETKQMIYKLRSLIDDKNSERLSNELVNVEGKVSVSGFSDNIQTIHEAIKSKQCLRFQYGRFNVGKEFLLSREGKYYEVSPFGVIWSQEYYYLIANEFGKEDKIHYRIDRMRNVTQLDKPMREEPEFNLEVYISKLFHMYPGEMSGIAMEFDDHLINVVIDRFGLGARIKSLDNGRFLLEVEGVVSMGLVRWLLTWGADVRAIRPQKLVDDMKKEIQRYEGLYT